MVGEKLKGNHVENGLKKLVGLGNGQDRIRQPFYFGITLSGHRDDRATAGFNFLQTPQVFVVHPVLSRDQHRRSARIDQGNHPVFEFSAGIALGMNIGDLFHLERPLQCDGKVGQAPQKKHGAGRGIFFSHAGHRGGVLQSLLNLLGKKCDLLQQIRAMRG